MFIKPHPYIKKVESNLDFMFSLFRVTNVKIENTPSSKHEIVYINSAYPAKDYNEIIYKTEGGIYLLYKTTGTTGYYSLEVYFLPNQIGPIQIFLNSILKKNDTTII